jgi:hypothetical protein
MIHAAKPPCSHSDFMALHKYFFTLYITKIGECYSINSTKLNDLLRCYIACLSTDVFDNAHGDSNTYGLTISRRQLTCFKAVIFAA